MTNNINGYYVDANFPDKHVLTNIDSKRIGNIQGDHLVQYESDDDIITIKHSANNRKGFAKGVILAAEFIKNNRGIFSIEDVLNKT